MTSANSEIEEAKKQKIINGYASLVLNQERST